MQYIFISKEMTWVISIILNRKLIDNTSLHTAFNIHILIMLKQRDLRQYDNSLYSCEQ